jgi:hypothetical protein
MDKRGKPGRNEEKTEHMGFKPLIKYINSILLLHRQTLCIITTPLPNKLFEVINPPQKLSENCIEICKAA